MPVMPRVPHKWPRRLRAAAAMVLLVLAVLIAGSWVKSYWRSDDVALTVKERISFGLGDVRGQIVLGATWPPNLGNEPIITHSSGPPRQLNSWPFVKRLFGFGYSHMEVFHAGSTIYLIDSTNTAPPFPSGPPDLRSDAIYIPHWFLLLLFGGGAWFLGRPWLRSRSQGRGFEVVKMENSSRNDATLQRPDNSVAP